MENGVRTFFSQIPCLIESFSPLKMHFFTFNVNRHYIIVHPLFIIYFPPLHILEILEQTVKSVSLSSWFRASMENLFNNCPSFPEAVVEVLCTPDDGCGWHPKHVE